MTLTFLDIYNECAGQPWSMFDNDAESDEDFESAMKISINKAISYLWNLQPWSFRKYTQKLRTKVDRALYVKPNGIIIKKTIDGTTKYGVKYEKTFLDYQSDYELLEDKTGEPEAFYLQGDNLYLYPTPDDVYNIEIEYLLLPYGLNKDDEQIYELTEDDDYINIPEKYESLFKNCLISLAMIYAIADNSDENHSGYQRQYEDCLKTLMQYCLDTLVDRNFVW